MADLLLNQIPPQIVTAEQLGCYACSLLYDLFGRREYREVQNADLTPLVTAQQGKAADDSERLIYRVSFQMRNDWRTSTNRVWMDTIEFAEATIPPGYLA